MHTSIDIVRVKNIIIMKLRIVPIFKIDNILIRLWPKVVLLVHETHESTQFS